jgi:hypothetical protein
MLIDPGISGLHIAIVSSMRLIVSAISSLLVRDDVVNALEIIVRVPCGESGGTGSHSFARIVAVGVCPSTSFQSHSRTVS